MQLYFILILCATQYVIGHDQVFDALNFLERTGYLDDLDGGFKRYHAPDNIKHAIKEYQTYTGLPVSGRLDKPTLKTMKARGCDFPDVIKPSLRPSYLRDSSNIDIAPLDYNYTPPWAPTKWHKSHLTWRFTEYNNKFTQWQQQQIIAKALKMWSDVCSLTFEMRTYGEVDMIFKFVAGAHDDNAFDGPGGILAHANSPGNDSLAGDVHFDLEENWSISEDLTDYDSGLSLLRIAAHEIGHALGLGHSSERMAVMHMDPKFPLQNDDIAGIQSIYGARPGTQPVTTTTRRPPTTEYATGAYCDLRFDAVEQVHNGDIYLFVGQAVYRMTSRGPQYEDSINRVYQGAPSYPGAVVYQKTTRKLFIFKGTQYWRYTGWNLDAGYPKTLPRDFYNIDAAYAYSDGEIQVIQISDVWSDHKESNVKGTTAAHWSEDMNEYEYGKASPLNTIVKKVDAIFTASNDKIYWFSGDSYWKDVIKGWHYATMVRGFPKRIRPFWLSCGTASDNEGSDLFGYPGK